MEALAERCRARAVSCYYKKRGKKKKGNQGEI